MSRAFSLQRRTVDSDRDEREEEEAPDFGVRLNMFEPLSTAGSAAGRDAGASLPCVVLCDG